MLRWAGVNHDEGPDCGGPHAPYVQSQRLPLYREAADRLLESGHAYRCFCSADRLQQLREGQRRRGAPPQYDRHCLHQDQAAAEERAASGEPHVVRLRVPAGQVTVSDAVRGDVTFNSAAIDDQVLLKSDGFPTYHLACVVDDHDMAVTHVMRGEEWLSSTAKHVLIAQALGVTPPTYAHLPLLLNPDRTKLSKRQGDVAVEDYKAKDFLPAALVNFVAFLGWAPAQAKDASDVPEVMTVEELAEAFSIDRVHTSGAVVDLEKLEWFNGQHIRRACQGLDGPGALDEVVSRATPHIASAVAVAAAAAPDGSPVLAVDAADRHTREVVVATHERVRVFSDFARAAHAFFVQPDLGEAGAAALLATHWQADTPARLELVLDALDGVWEARGADVSDKDLFAAVRGVAKTHKIKPAQVMMPLRIATTGSNVGAELGTVLRLLGRETVRARVRHAAATMDSTL